MANKEENVGVWYNVLGAALQIPGAKVNRNDFLRNEFGKYCNDQTIEKAINQGTIQAGIEVTLMDKIADDSINFHTNIATTLSFAAGIPGGLAMIATIPADIAQYYYHVIVIAQKLAYIYGMKELGMIDDNFKSLLTLLVGVMADIKEANKTVTEIYSKQVSQEIALLSLVKASNKAVLKIAILLAAKITGKSALQSIGKVVPILGGIVSGGITLFSFSKMCKNLKDMLHNTCKKN